MLSGFELYPCWVPLNSFQSYKSLTCADVAGFVKTLPVGVHLARRLGCLRSLFLAMFNKLKYKERNFLQSANPIISVIWPSASFPYNLKKKKKNLCVLITTYKTKYGLVRLTTKTMAFFTVSTRSFYSLINYNFKKGKSGPKNHLWTRQMMILRIFI